jgi:hypothetical protein
MRSLVQHILSLVSHPVLSFLYRWIYDGELEDTYHEVGAEAEVRSHGYSIIPVAVLSGQGVSMPLHSPCRPVPLWSSELYLVSVKLPSYFE